jgi:hypothetical protein
MGASITELSRSQARRIALHAQGFGSPRPAGRIDRRHVRKLFEHVGLIQIDSVNVLVRSQELPLLARLGPHPRDVLPRMAADHELFEYWCHEASLMPIAMWPLVRWHMDRGDDTMWSGMRTMARENPAYVEAVYAEVRDRGPLAVGDLSEPGAKSEGMWGWSKGKKALEYLFWTGRLTAKRRASDFARMYDVTERCIPADVLAAPALSEVDATREMLALAAGFHGVATEGDLCDYHRLNRPKARPRIAELVEDGRLVPVKVQGWSKPAFVHPDAYLPRWIRARALLSPFDSVVWERDRTERLFDFRYRVEIYTPKHKRVHGYYVLPFLLGDRLVARVDLKADRAASSLLVQAAFAEPGCITPDVADALATELAVMAGFLGLDSVTVVGRGDLSPALPSTFAATVPSSGAGGRTPAP